MLVAKMKTEAWCHIATNLFHKYIYIYIGKQELNQFRQKFTKIGLHAYACGTYVTTSYA